MGARRDIWCITDLVAVFADADNLPASFADKIICQARSVGTVMLAKAYGNKKPLGNWQGKASFQFVYSGTGKNATDVLLAVEATAFAMSTPVQTVVLCSSDADFSHPARFLRQRGICVIGMGEVKTSEEMRCACSEFHVLTPTKTPVARPAPSPDLDRKIKSVFAECGIGDRGMGVTDLNAAMHRKFGTRISATEDKSWPAYLRNRTELYALDKTREGTVVRLKADEFA